MSGHVTCTFPSHIVVHQQSTRCCPSVKPHFSVMTGSKKRKGISRHTISCQGSLPSGSASRLHLDSTSRTISQKDYAAERVCALEQQIKKGQCKSNFMQHKFVLCLFFTVPFNFESNISFDPLHQETITRLEVSEACLRGFPDASELPDHAQEAARPKSEL